MPSYNIQFRKSAKKEFLKLNLKIQDKILEAFDLLSVNPYSELLNVKKLKGEEKLYRIRIGDYRVIYEIQNKELIILVIKIGHRREVYRKN